MTATPPVGSPDGRRGISISIKLIAISTLLVTTAVASFGIMNSIRTRRLIDESTEQLQGKIIEGLRQTGLAQLQLLVESSRIALVQSDYSTLQAVLENVQREDDRVIEVAVIDAELTYLAHGDPRRAGKKASPEVAATIKQVQRKPVEIKDGGEKALAFSARVVHEGEPFSTVFLAYTLKPLQAELAKARQRKEQERRESLHSSLLIGTVSALLGVILAIFQGLRISRPIRALAAQANRIAAGELHARVEIRSRDEIGELGGRFNYMAEQVLRLMRETSEKATMEKELEVASAIQATLVPSGDLLTLSHGVQLAGYFKPATQCGGDWWNYYELSDGRILVIIGDVTGHGVASAMITAAAKGAATSAIVGSGRSIGLRELLVNMNAAIHDAAQGRFVMTCFASIYDPATRVMTYANAGHTFPYLKDGERLLSLVARGNRLGDIVGSDFTIKQVTIPPGAYLVWYTDGIVECNDARGEEFGERRFRQAIKNAIGLPPDAARNQIVERANQFYGDVPQKDDITLIVAKFE